MMLTMEKIKEAEAQWAKDKEMMKELSECMGTREEIVAIVEKHMECREDDANMILRLKGEAGYIKNLIVVDKRVEDSPFMEVSWERMQDHEAKLEEFKCKVAAR